MINYTLHTYIIHICNILCLVDDCDISSVSLDDGGVTSSSNVSVNWRYMLCGKKNTNISC